MGKRALIDLDGTLADFAWSMERKLEEIATPGEQAHYEEHDSEPRHIKARRRLIKRQPGFWSGLKEMRLGFDVLDLMHRMGFSLTVLTKAPPDNEQAWAEKVQWVRHHLGEYQVKMTLTEAKDDIGGDVLLDDWPKYVLPWLENHPAGHVILPAHPYNEHLGPGHLTSHARITRYDGRNLDEVAAVLASIKEL